MIEVFLNLMIYSALIAYIVIIYLCLDECAKLLSNNIMHEWKDWSMITLLLLVSFIPLLNFYVYSELKNLNTYN
jgi:hypothetical protein